MSTVPFKPPASTVAHFRSARELCRKLLRESRTPTGHWIPLTSADVAGQLTRAGYPVNERDAEAFLRELAISGEVVEIDRDAGFRWAGEAA
jgi:hypothetical protein